MITKNQKSRNRNPITKLLLEPNRSYFLELNCCGALDSPSMIDTP